MLNHVSVIKENITVHSAQCTNTNTNTTLSPSFFHVVHTRHRTVFAPYEIFHFIVRARTCEQKQRNSKPRKLKNKNFGQPKRHDVQNRKNQNLEIFYFLSVKSMIQSCAVIVVCVSLSLVASNTLSLSSNCDWKTLIGLFVSDSYQGLYWTRS